VSSIQPEPLPDTASAAGAPVDTMALPHSRWGRRGYAKPAVDQLVARLNREVEHYRAVAHDLRVTAHAMAAEVAHRRGGLLPDYSLSAPAADTLIAAQVEAQRHSDNVLRVAQQHARELVAAAQQHAAQVVPDQDTDDATALRQRVREYQQLAISMRDYLSDFTRVLTDANHTFTQRLALIRTTNHTGQEAAGPVGTQTGASR
jgi:cell division septum initiation protein DivIVA